MIEKSIKLDVKDEKCNSKILEITFRTKRNYYWLECIKEQVLIFECYVDNTYCRRLERVKKQYDVREKIKFNKNDSMILTFEMFNDVIPNYTILYDGKWYKMFELTDYIIQGIENELMLDFDIDKYSKHQQKITCLQNKNIKRLLKGRDIKDYDFETMD